MELLLREEVGSVRELVSRIQFEIWNNAETPNLNYIFFNSESNFLAAAKSEGAVSEVFCAHLFQVKSNVLWRNE